MFSWISQLPSISWTIFFPQNRECRRQILTLSGTEVTRFEINMNRCNTVHVPEIKLISPLRQVCHSTHQNIHDIVLDLDMIRISVGNNLLCRKMNSSDCICKLHVASSWRRVIWSDINFLYSSWELRILRLLREHNNWRE